MSLCLPVKAIQVRIKHWLSKQISDEYATVLNVMGSLYTSENVYVLEIPRCGFRQQFSTPNSQTPARTISAGDNLCSLHVFSSPKGMEQWNSSWPVLDTLAHLPKATRILHVLPNSFEIIQNGSVLQNSVTMICSKKDTAGTVPRLNATCNIHLVRRQGREMEYPI